MKHVGYNRSTNYMGNTTRVLISGTILRPLQSFEFPQVWIISQVHQHFENLKVWLSEYPTDLWRLRGGYHPPFDSALDSEY